MNTASFPAPGRGDSGHSQGDRKASAQPATPHQYLKDPLFLHFHRILFKRNYLKYNNLPQYMQRHPIVDLSSNILILLLMVALIWYAMISFAF
ncbi:hypothetical protein AZH53_03805 [Methanomicrobiaceae archaeon CYW5]|nr:hypothetical protein [Methanovulcanius yangii]